MSSPRILAALVLCLGATATAQESGESSCVLCHSNTDFFTEEEIHLVTEHLGSVHAEVGVSCHDCHGGNHDLDLFEDMDASMDPDHSPRPYRGVPTRAEIPAACGSCHSDPVYMVRFRPDPRVDQEREYRTSHHGVALAAGDGKVATCTDCHGAHDVLRPSAPESRVHPKRVAETCGACHSDRDRMLGYTLLDGTPLPVDQEAKWRRSVHAAALLEREDLSAPTCNDCHGNHGARPPGVDSIFRVCGQCHGREADLFAESSKRELWQEHNEFLADVDPESCAACHDESEPQGRITSMHHFSECGSCHGNHGVVRPTLALFAPFDATPCAFCHEGVEEGLEVDLIGAAESRYRDTLDALIEEARSLGLHSEDRFDWLVDRSLELAEHGASTSEVGRGRGAGRFDRLFQKFRIGKTFYEYEPAPGEEPVRVELQRCTWCHAEATSLEDASEGHKVGQEMAARAITLMALTGRAERSLAAARQAGIELRDARLEVDRAVDAQIDLQVLSHRFRTDGEFAEAVARGRAHALAAIRAGEEAQAELRFRRVGLLVFIGFVVCVLIGLAIKIRQT